MATKTRETYAGKGQPNEGALIATEVVTVSVEEDVQDTLEARLRTRIPRMRAIANAASFTVAERDQAIRDCAQTNLWLLRMFLRALDATD